MTQPEPQDLTIELNVDLESELAVAGNYSFEVRGFFSNQKDVKVSYEVLVTLNEPVACANFSIEFLEPSAFE